MGLIVKSLNYVHPDNETLFQELNFIFNDGEKASLTGINGAGKSTLLRLIAGQLPLQSGAITCSMQPWYVPQHLGEFDTWSVARALAADKKLDALYAILGGDTDPQHFADLDEDWDIERTIKKALDQWGLGAISQDRLLGSLSGGEKTKVFLAALDINKPDFIVLDEPSNHLDTAGRAKLYNLIRQSKATMLIVSHDRTLLNMMDKTLELSEKGITVFGGNFDFYLQQKNQKVYALQARLNEQFKTLKQYKQKAGDMASLRADQEYRGRSSGLSNSIPRIIAGGLKNRAERSTAKMQDAHSEKITALEEDICATQAQIQQYEALKIDIGASALPSGKLLIDVAGINFGYNGQPLWNDLSFQVRSGDRVQIEGDNGAGKTTLLKIITHKLQPLSGTYFIAECTYLYLDQDYTMINPELTVYEQVQEYNRSGLEAYKLKTLLYQAQFDNETLDQKCAGLSGGEKMKLALCCSIASNPAPDVLVLDEPTNNLDVQSQEVLTLAVKHFEGTLLVISHDAYFVKEVGITQRIQLT